MNEWDRKEEWHRHGGDFLVVVKHHTVSYSSVDVYRGQNRWCVYVYVYPKHRHFSKFSGSQMWQEAATCIPFHGGPSLLRWHYSDDGKPTSVQVGADYDHLHDDQFSHYATPEEAYEVFADAEELFSWMTS